MSSVLQLAISRGGLPKLPILEADVTPLGIAGDVQKNRKYHGGPLQALLLITAEGLEELQAAGYPVYPGALGENITTRGLDRRLLRLGQRYRLGEVEIELTKMRQPCRALAPFGDSIRKAVYDADVQAGRPTSPRWGLAGFYAKVLEPGRLYPGDPITLLPDPC
ncbi:MAG: MOSC domain-containing protein [Acidobacteria bacterium]|nr:MOSC domain-containing protein [Acidobacteriota bacterium]